MSGGLFPERPFPAPGGPDPVEHLDPVRRRELLRRWEVRAAQWRATALAEWAFGGRVVPRVAGGPGGGGFRGLLELEVPFRRLEEHREAEARFLEAARRDELLGGFPLVILFAPRPVASEVP